MSGRSDGKDEASSSERGPQAPCPGRPQRRPCCRRRGGGGGALVEPAALAALLSADGYGYDMRRTILEMSGGEVDVDSGGLYRSLRRLEDEGAVVSRWVEDCAGPRRREYELTEEGVGLAEQWLAALRARRRLDGLLVDLLEQGLNAASAGDEAAAWADEGGADASAPSDDGGQQDPPSGK
ncbi:MAG: PadR family transcriptional regulator [Eggerthellaceae bacterium]|nr:PadR family transcriptional regulator [Eggerthellaceae bacterium]